ncbi:MAG TPA: glycosyltransferase family 2 protein [Bryobacteraceae bacterium]|nr:glycosyltransferase family 2 protein [Bryobacteraceae bacterium]
MVAIPHAGKAACLNPAFEKADGDVLFITDVRQLLDPQALSCLVANFADPGVGAATGEMRLLPGSSGEHRDTDLYWRYELWTRRRHSEIDSLFTTTGCIYALRRELAVALPPDTLSDDAYLALIAFSRGYRVIFDPQAIAFDYPAVAGTEFRRRWRKLAGRWQIHMRMPWLFTSANRMRIHFLSHKFSRLVLPWAMLAILAFTAALALLDRWIPSSLVFKAALFARPYIPADECRGDGGSCNVIYTRAKALETDARRGSGG